jgi:formylglycine-generating enzyme required for sulfatase activity
MVDGVDKVDRYKRVIFIAGLISTAFMAGAEEAWVNSVGMRMMPIPAGAFLMGEPNSTGPEVNAPQAAAPSHPAGKHPAPRNPRRGPASPVSLP